MSEMNGFDILEKLQADKKLRDIPVLIIGGTDLTAEQNIQLSEFGQRMLKKGSFSEKELLTSIQRALERINNNKSNRSFLQCLSSSNALIAGTMHHTTRHPPHAQSATVNGVRRNTITNLLVRRCLRSWKKDHPASGDTAKLLPVRNPNISLSLGEGGSPLIRAVNLGMMLGCPNIYIKDERQGPTSSFKDRQASVTIAALKEAGITEMVAASTGNVAISYSAYASRAGKSWALSPALSRPLRCRDRFIRKSGDQDHRAIRN